MKETNEKFFFTATEKNVNSNELKNSNIILETPNCELLNNVPYIKLFKTPKRNDIVFVNNI